jgi:hypothetical protein
MAHVHFQGKVGEGYWSAVVGRGLAFVSLSSEIMNRPS